MLKSYLRYEQRDCFGVIASPAGNAVFDATGNMAICPALQDVIVWQLRRGTTTSIMHAESGEVTRLALNGDGTRVAAGYSDGAVRVWQLEGGKLLHKFTGHRKAVSALAFSGDGTVLASGARDTDIVLWDLVHGAGQYRLRGHKDEVTDLAFVDEGASLISVSKDTLVKFWDLETRHCVQTCVGHRGEVWSCAVAETRGRLVTGAADNQLRVWRIVPRDEAEAQRGDDAPAAEAPAQGEETALDALVAARPATASALQRLVYMGALHRDAGEKTASVRFDTTRSLLAAQSPGKRVEVYRLRDAAEATRKQRRRMQRQREKASRKRAKKGSGESEKEGKEEGEGASAALVATDEFELHATVATGHKARSVSFAPSADPTTARLLVALGNNSAAVFGVPRAPPQEGGVHEGERQLVLSQQGHRSDVRAVALSSDDSMLASASNGMVKVWNARTGQCIRTLACGFGLCTAFLPGDRHLAVGTKEGTLTVFDLGSGDAVQEEQAHRGALWSIDVRPDRKGMVTGSADHDVKFWDFELVEGANGAMGLAVEHARTLKMSDDVLCVRYSKHRDPAKLLVCVALLDSTVKVFFDDSLRFFLSLYGHKLPVMAMDISDDNALLVTASADKNVKLWGLDFGDCHRSLFAHADSVMAARFVKDSHLFFTAGKDGTVKYWDGDRHESISTLQGHCGEVWCLAVSQEGDFLISGSHDRSLRFWRRTKELVFAEEERKLEQEQRMEEEVEQEEEKEEAATLAKDGAPEQGAAGKRSMESLRAAERLAEAVRLAEESRQNRAEHRARVLGALRRLSPEEREARRQRRRERKEVKPLISAPAQSPLMLGQTPLRFMCRTLRSIRASELEPALLVLNLDETTRLLDEMLRAGVFVELAARCLFLLLKVHYKQVVSHEALLLKLLSLRKTARLRLREVKDREGFNLAATDFFKRQLESNKGIVFMDSDTRARKRARQ